MALTRRTTRRRSSARSSALRTQPPLATVTALQTILVRAASLALLAIAAFGLLATLEPMPAQQAWTWRALYFALALAALAPWLLAARRS